MLRHLFKFMWNKKRQNFLLLLELFISFIVLFILFSFVVNYYQNFRRPYGFEYDNVLSISFVKNISEGDTNSNAFSDRVFNELFKATLKVIPGVEAVSFSNMNIPFAFSANRTYYKYKNVKAHANYYNVEDDYPKVLSIKITNGRWFSKVDEASKNKPIVITQSLKDKLFRDENPIGKILGEEKIVGVINDIKDKDDFDEIESGVFRRISKDTERELKQILIKVDPKAKGIIEYKIYQAFSSNKIISNMEMEFLIVKKARKNTIKLVPMILMLIVSSFLIINVCLGLFGVLWYNIHHRKAEIGLRRAIGASGIAVTTQLIAEALIMATFALILGSFFAVQFPLLHIFDLAATTYLIAIALAIIFIYLLVILCALYPGRQAASIQPAIALHED